MSSTDNPPSLALSDIMHHMSPSPAPTDEHSGLPAATNDFGSGDGSKDTFISSEVKSSTDVAGIRRRLIEMGFSVIGQLNSLERSVDFVASANISPREKELLDMVISLSQAVAVDPTQLERQAETIANLTTHRDFLAGQIAEERERWQSERESWDRTAEALLSLRNKPSKSEDIERVRASYESENRMLRMKLQDYQKRQVSLESELTKLKPLLFLQPFTVSRRDKGKGREFVPKPNLVSIPEGREMKETEDKTPYYHNHQSQSQSKIPSSPPTPSTSKPTSATQPSLPPRRFRDHVTHSKSLGNRDCQTFTSDAYMDHLLLAMKKIGRKRAAIVTGIVQHAEREKEALVYEQEQIRSQKEQERMEQDRQERIASGAYGAYYRTGPEASTSSPQQQRDGGQSKTATPLPRTPKRNNALHYSNMATSSVSSSAGHNSTANMESSLVYVDVNTATSAYDSPWAGSGVMGTPGQIKSALNRQNGRTVSSEKGGIPNNPTTPLASLLDAALMMDEGGRPGTKQKGKMNGKGRLLDEPDSPVPKRRKTSSGKSVMGAGGLGIDRVKSALDVLADQADQASAAFNDTEQSDKRPSTSNNSNDPELNGKGKGKAKESFHTQDSEDVQMDEQQNIPSAFGSNELVFVTSNGRGRPRRESSAATSRGKAGSTPTPTSTSRPVRQASRKRVTSPDRNTASTSGTTTRGSARARGGGQLKGSTSTSRSAAVAPSSNADGSGSGSILADGKARMISPAGGLRVITPGPRYSPLDEALAMTNSRKTTPDNGIGDSITSTRDCGEHAHAKHSHPHSMPSFSSGSKPTPSQSQSQLGGPNIKGGLLRPVTVSGWGIRNQPTVDESGSSSPMRGIEHASVKPQDSGSSPGPSLDPPERLESVPIPRSPRGTVTDTDVFSSPEPPRHVSGDIHETKLLPTPSAVDFKIPDAHAGIDDDPDAEGEQEDGEGEDDDNDDEKDADAEAESEGEPAKHTSRSKSPPPPDPPPPGPDSGSPPDQQDDHDTDADAEGEMDLEDVEDPHPPSGGGTTSTSSSFSSSGRKSTTNSADGSIDLATTLFMFVISVVTPLHLEVPTALSILDPYHYASSSYAPRHIGKVQLSARSVHSPPMCPQTHNIINHGYPSTRMSS